MKTMCDAILFLVNHRFSFPLLHCLHLSQPTLCCVLFYCCSVPSMSHSRIHALFMFSLIFSQDTILSLCCTQPQTCNGNHYITHDVQFFIFVIVIYSFISVFSSRLAKISHFAFTFSGNVRFSSSLKSEMIFCRCHRTFVRNEADGPANNAKQGENAKR